MTRNTDRPKSNSGLKTLAGLIPFLSPYRRHIIAAGIALVIAASATLAIPYGFRQLIDLGFTTAGTQKAWCSYILLWTIISLFTLAKIQT